MPLSTIADTGTPGMRISMVAQPALQAYTNMQQRTESTIDAGDAGLKGWLEIPADAAGVVAFAHGSGSSRFSRRNNAVAQHL